MRKVLLVLTVLCLTSCSEIPVSYKDITGGYITNKEAISTNIFTGEKSYYVYMDSIDKSGDIFEIKVSVTPTIYWQIYYGRNGEYVKFR